jgi:DNA repair protein RecO (recombination protein O)
MKYQKLTGLIILSNQLKEANKLMTIFTKENGKVKVIAKGVNKTLSRKNYNLDCLNLINFNVYITKSDFNLLTDTVLVNDFNLLKKDFIKIKIAYYIFEVLNRFLVEEVIIPGLFDRILSLLTTLTKIDDDNQKMLLLLYAQIIMLDEFGYSPQLNNCIICSDELAPDGKRILSYEEILGYVCDKHFDIISNKDNLVEDKVIKIQKFLLRSSLQDIFQLIITNNDIFKIFSLQNSWIENILEKKVKSYNLIVSNK